MASRGRCGRQVPLVADIEFCGESFELAEKVSSLALMRFARAVSNGADTDTMEGMAALYDALQQMLPESEWKRFERHADKIRADADDLLDFVGNAMAAISARPTERPSESSDGPVTTKPLSPDDSSSRVIARMEASGRPDLALLVTRTQESLVG